MKEIRDIVCAYSDAQKNGLHAVLATVVHVQGSSYRRPGARMLITEDGRLTGAISGGCLDGHILRKALLVMTEKKPLLVTYDTTDEDDTLRIGLGCNGLVQIFIEPLIIGDPGNPVRLLKQIVSHRQKAVLATIFSVHDSLSVQPATAILSFANGAVMENMADEAVKAILVSDLKKTHIDEMPATIFYSSDGQSLKVFIDYIEPAVSLVIVGAGNDAMPLAELSNVLGWQTTVVDGRSNYATRERFPTAQQVLVAKTGQLPETLEIDRQTVFVLMTHNYDYDLAVLEQLIAKDMPYIGILGPQKKQEKLLGELEGKGVFVDDKKSKLFGPTGLDIGAETPEEIALSIIAEIKKVLGQGNGMSLREKKSNIHANVAESVTVPFF